MVSAVQPVAEIRAAVAQGAITVRDIASRTGLPETLVDAVLDHLARTGELRGPQSCSPGGCSGCPEQVGCDGPVLLTLGPTCHNGR